MLRLSKDNVNFWENFKPNRVGMKKKKLDDNRLALLWISQLGQGIKEDVKDWSNIGKMAVNKARETLAKKCPKCGKPE